MKKLLLLLVLLGNFTSAFAGFKNIKSTGEIESEIPADKIIQSFTTQYTHKVIGVVKLNLILVKEESSHLKNRVILSIINKDRNEIYTLGTNVTSLRSIERPHKNDSDVVEIDLRKNNRLIEINLLPLINSMNGQREIFNEIVIFDNQGYKRSVTP